MDALGTWSFSPIECNEPCELTRTNRPSSRVDAATFSSSCCTNPLAARLRCIARPASASRSSRVSRSFECGRPWRATRSFADGGGGGRSAGRSAKPSTGALPLTNPW